LFANENEKKIGRGSGDDEGRDLDRSKRERVEFIKKV